MEPEDLCNLIHVQYMSMMCGTVEKLAGKKKVSDLNVELLVSHTVIKVCIRNVILIF